MEQAGGRRGKTYAYRHGSTVRAPSGPCATGFRWFASDL
jgi:hypothetical protein